MQSSTTGTLDAQLGTTGATAAQPQPTTRRPALIGLSSGALGVAPEQQPAAGSRSLADQQRAGPMPETPQGMSRGGSPWVCRTCGLQYTATETPPDKCKTCLDERQYVGADVSQLPPPGCMMPTVLAVPMNVQITAGAAMLKMCFRMLCHDIMPSWCMPARMRPQLRDAAS
jgi:hypothetical protein